MSYQIQDVNLHHYWHLKGYGSLVSLHVLLRWGCYKDSEKVGNKHMTTNFAAQSDFRSLVAAM